jgi:hypothetical protein
VVQVPDTIQDKQSKLLPDNISVHAQADQGAVRKAIVALAGFLAGFTADQMDHL